MNLNAIANGPVTSINGNVIGSILTSTGYTTNAAGQRTPTFSRVDGVAIQEQPLSPAELEHLDALNIQNVTRSAFVNAAVSGVDRGSQTGGDFLYFNSIYWLVTIVFEPWDASGWTKVGLTKQVKAPV